MNRPGYLPKTDICKELSFSSDDTEFLNLPTTSAPSNFNRFDRNNDAQLYTRMSDFDPDSIDEPDAEAPSTPPSTPSSSSDSHESRESTPVNYICDKTWSSSDEETSFYRDKMVAPCSEFSSPDVHARQTTPHIRCYAPTRGGYLISQFDLSDLKATTNCNETLFQI